MRGRPDGAEGIRAVALADALALVVFAVVGMVSHHRLGAAGFARDALPLLAAWFAVASLDGLYRRGGVRRLLATWLVAIPLAVGVRALALGRALDRHEAAFLATTLVFTLVFVGAGRAALRAAGRPQPRARFSPKRPARPRR